MKLEFNVEQINKITQTIDAGLKNTHVGGLNVMEGAVIFAQGVTQAQQKERIENSTLSNPIIPVDAASQS